MELLDIIRSRRSIRVYSAEPVEDNKVSGILEAARWAPSGLNNQPWRFAVIRDGSFKKQLSELTHYSRIVADSALLIAVFYNTPAGYNRDKDLMSIGASIQNMLLYAHNEGIGSVWLGEILKNREKVNALLDIDSSNEFVALLAFGIPGEDVKGERKDVNDLILRVI